MQRKLDSYQNHMKLGQSVEALNALITGLQTYDTINQEAESYGVLAEVDSIKDEILAILESEHLKLLHSVQASYDSDKNPAFSAS